MDKIKIDNLQLKKSKRGSWYAVVESNDLPDQKATAWDKDVISALKFAHKENKTASVELEQNQNGYWNITKVYSLPKQETDDDKWERIGIQKAVSLWIESYIRAGKKPAEVKREIDEWVKIVRGYGNGKLDDIDKELVGGVPDEPDEPVDFDNPVPNDDDIPF